MSDASASTVSHQDLVVMRYCAVGRNPAVRTLACWRSQSTAKYWYSRSCSAQQASATSVSSASSGFLGTVEDPLAERAAAGT